MGGEPSREKEDEDDPADASGYSNIQVTLVIFADVESKIRLKVINREVNMAASAVKKYLDWVKTRVTFNQSDHPANIATCGRQDPLYPEGHPKRIEQDSQLQEEDIVSSPKKKKKHKEADNSNDPITDEEPIVDPNSISISDAETEDGVEPDKDNEKIDPPEMREEEAPHKCKRYTREDFVARKHGKEREPWVQKSMPFTDAIKLPPYSRYMKDIVTNKRKFPNEAISTMLANYSFSGKIPEKLGDPGIPTIPCSIKIIMSELLYVILVQE
ncbi:hypothetical protein ZWY2020_057077 [Hordeum vulgare]|nr:hypothetical protein ZWY2020_057077 [Hordeum vulgare]